MLVPRRFFCEPLECVTNFLRCEDLAESSLDNLALWTILAESSKLAWVCATRR